MPNYLFSKTTKLLNVQCCLVSISYISAQLSHSSSVIVEVSGGSAAMLLQLLLDVVGSARESSSFRPFCHSTTIQNHRLHPTGIVEGQ